MRHVRASFVFVGVILLGVGIGRMLGWDSEIVWLIALGSGFLLYGLMGGGLEKRRREDR